MDADPSKIQGHTSPEERSAVVPAPDTANRTESAAHTAPPGDLSRAVVRARNTLATFGGDEITEAIILLDHWLARQDEATKQRLAAYFGHDDLPVSARPGEKS